MDSAQVDGREDGPGCEAGNAESSSSCPGAAHSPRGQANSRNLALLCRENRAPYQARCHFDQRYMGNLSRHSLSLM